MENRTIAFMVALLLAGSCLCAQSPVISAGIELQGYPAGFIVGPRVDFQLSPHITGNLRIGYNFARRGDQGEHDNERGGGPGFSIGGRYYFQKEHSGVFLGLRSDVWFMNIDWRSTSPNIRGTTEITVLQPLGEGGYTFLLVDGQWAITMKISLGYEINISTSGEEVGEGPISLLGVSFSKRFLR